MKKIIIVFFLVSFVQASEIQEITKKLIKTAQEYEVDGKSSLELYYKEVQDKGKDSCFCHLITSIGCFINASEAFFNLYYKTEAKGFLEKAEENYKKAIEYLDNDKILKMLSNCTRDKITVLEARFKVNDVNKKMN